MFSAIVLAVPSMRRFPLSTENVTAGMAFLLLRLHLSCFYTRRGGCPGRAGSASRRRVKQVVKMSIDPGLVGREWPVEITNHPALVEQHRQLPGVGSSALAELQAPLLQRRVLTIGSQ